MAVDVGNTQTVLGLIDGGEPRGQWRIATEAHRTADELAVTFAGLLALEGLSPHEVSAMIVSSVVPGLAHSYRTLASEVFGVPYYAVTAEMETGLDNRYDDPGAVGADRIVNAVAAVRHYGFPVIIVDIGTATTVEAVIRRSRDELGEDGVKVVATGGPAGVIVPYCREIQEFDPDLTLKGLLALYEMNA